jgi:CAAX prenyl protease-like protein
VCKFTWFGYLTIHLLKFFLYVKIKAMNTNEKKAAEPAKKNSKKARRMDQAAYRHAAPFVLWLGIVLLANMMHLTEGSGTEDIKSLNLVSLPVLYAIRTAICLVALFICRPWRYYSALNPKNILPAIGLGLGVFVLWIGLETEFVKSLCPSLAGLYETWCVKPFGAMREPLETTPYAPSVCGVMMTAVRFIGSAFVISIIEEFFWRGYLLRTARTPDFLDIDIGQLHWPSFLIVAAIFAIEHNEVLAGFICGIVYGLFYIKTKDIWAAAIAHITTNAVLGIYVLATGKYIFW